MEAGMKFFLKNIQNGCRLGYLTETSSSAFGGDLCTPLCLLYTRGGSVPYLPKDLLVGIENLPGVVQFPTTLLAENVEVLSQYGKGICSFAALKDFLSYCTVQDSAEHVPTGYNAAAGVSVWGRGGKLMLDAASYTRAMEAFQPDWYQALCDSDTDRTSSRKRIRKSVDRTLVYLDQCIELQAKSMKLKKSGIIGVVEGGFSLPERLRSVRETAKRQVSGFCIEGFQSLGPDMAQLRITEVASLLSAVLGEIPVNMPRILPGPWMPVDIIEAVKMGVDIFDSVYPYMVTSRGNALVFNYKETIPVEDDLSEGEKVVEVPMKDARWSDDTRPILEQCSCYTCVTHTRAYVFHLLETSELLAGILLMIHNFHHFFGFFKAIREAIANNNLDALERRISMYTHLPVTVGSFAGTQSDKPFTLDNSTK